MTFFPRKNRILDNIRNNKISLGLELYTGNPSLVEIMAYAGFDFYMLDMEHAAVDIDTMRHCIRAADAAGITTITRVAENNPALISRAVEEGSQGIIVPQVSSREDARKAMDAMRYPPEGKKGSCPYIRGSNYSTKGWDDYLEHHSNEAPFIPIIENLEGVENMEEIFAELKPGVDIVSLGGGDLAQCLAKPGEKVKWDHPYIIEAKKKYFTLSKKYGVPVMGGPWPDTTVEEARKIVDQGAKVILFSIDQKLLYDACIDIVKGMHE